MKRTHNSFTVTITVPTELSEHDIECEVDVSPEEKSSWSEWDGGYPGCPASFEITSAMMLHYFKHDGINMVRHRKISAEDLQDRTGVEDLIWDQLCDRAHWGD